jgi:hypothetical protein
VCGFDVELALAPGDVGLKRGIVSRPCVLGREGEGAQMPVVLRRAPAEESWGGTEQDLIRVLILTIVPVPFLSDAMSMYSTAASSHRKPGDIVLPGVYHCLRWRE